MIVDGTKVGNASSAIAFDLLKTKDYNALYMHLPPMVADIVFGIFLMLFIGTSLVRLIKKAQAQVCTDENLSSWNKWKLLHKDTMDLTPV